MREEVSGYKASDCESRSNTGFGAGPVITGPAFVMPTKEIPQCVLDAPSVFWGKVEKAGESDCWSWRGHVNDDGYGRYQYRDKFYQAHRVAWALQNGQQPPTGLVSDHICRNRSCVNPSHLEFVSSMENTRRGFALFAQRTHCRRGHQLTPENVRQDGRTRRCRECERQNGRKWRATNSGKNYHRDYYLAHKDKE